MPSGAIADCPHCGASLPLKNRAAVGKTANCPRCKQPFVVKLREEPGAAGTGDDETPDEYALPDDIKALAHPVLEHRMGLRPEAQMRGEMLPELIEDIMTRLRVPGTTSRIAT